MSDQSNSAYFAARAFEERELSRTAADPSAAIAHAQMADRYQRLALEFSGRRPKLHVATTSAGNMA
jgi:hypothetical protein